MVRKASAEESTFGKDLQIVRVTFGVSDKTTFSVEDDGLIAVQPPTKGDPCWKVYLPNDQIRMFHGLAVEIIAYRTYEEEAIAEEE